MDNHATAIQQQKILEYLQINGSATTIELRHELDVMMPAARIHELRHDYGHNIVTVWTNDITPEGSTHRVARYVLQSGKYQGVAA